MTRAWPLKKLQRFLKPVAAAWGLFLGVSLATIGLWYFYGPTTLTIAVVKGPEEGVVRALSGSLYPRHSIHLKFDEVANFRTAAAALDAKRVDLALVQPDVAFPANAGTVAILREEVLIILTPAKAKIDDIAKLAAKRIAMIVRRQSDIDLMHRAFTQYDLNGQTFEIRSEDFIANTYSERLEVLAFLAAPGTPYARQLVDVAARIFGSELTVVPLQGVTALSRASPGVGEATIGAGTLRGRPPLPVEDVKTLNSSYRLVASSELDRAIVSRVTEALFQQRQAIARSVPDANLIKAPDNDEAMSAILPNHRGAIDYFNREQLTFMDKYGDWLWLGLFAAGGITSVLGWLVELFARKRREAVDVVLERLQRILAEARECKTSEDLTRLTMELDKLVARAINQTRKKTTTATTMGALMMSIDSARHAIHDQRRELSSNETTRPVRKLMTSPV